MSSQFYYDASKDQLNCIRAESPDKEFTEHPIRGEDNIVRLLAHSQPSSIFNNRTKTLRCFGRRATLLKRAIVLPNSYELFLSPWLADGTFSYPHENIRRDWKTWFPAGHNARRHSGRGITTNALEDNAFDGTTCLLDKRVKYVIKNHADANNYWHWTFEWLPRLFYLKKILEREGCCAEEVTFVNIGSRLNSFQKEWVELLLGKPLDIKTYNQPLLCERLLWVTPPFPAHHDGKTILEIRNHMAKQGHNGALKGQKQMGSTQRIYLLRGEARNGRRIRNESEIIERLMVKGFIPMAMDGLSVGEQAKIFGNASIIVGAHGSAFVNMVFCKETCRIIELFGPGYVSGHDYSLAHTCGISWEFIEGEPADTNPSFTSDFYIDTNKLVRRLDELAM